MIISEVNAVLDLVVKSTTFISQLKDGWYKGSAELDTFRNKVWMLSAKHAQWSEQLQRYGTFEDKHLLRLVKEAEETLEKQHLLVRKLQKSPFSRWKKRVFPGQLSYFLDKVLEIVDAGPQLLKTRVENNYLLERYLGQTPAPLPFGADRNYVPIADSILALQETLENAEGARVVTLHGGPGMGKSSLMKYLAIHYQEEQKRLQTDASFPHGVYYLYCGQHAGERVKQLQLQLLENLGFGTGFDPTTTNTGIQEGDYISLTSTLRSRLAHQKLLIALDDVWEAKLVAELLIPARGVKYLVTSQMRDMNICADSEKIQIARPTLKECSHIMANYTDGLPDRGEFPDDIKKVVEDISRTLDRHPLSLANVGISINRSEATAIQEWHVIKKHIYEHLAENDSYCPPAFDRPYNLSVSASMMLMVESLPPEAQRLLFLMVVLKGQHLPEPLMKYFYSFVQGNNFRLKYRTQVRCLTDKSLLETTEWGDTSAAPHSLRTRYILERKMPQLRSMASNILASGGHQDVAKRGNGEGNLITLLSAMYYDESLNDVVASTLKNHFIVTNDGFGFIPRSLDTEASTLDLVKSARRHKSNIRDLIWLLNADHEEDNWKRLAHDSAKKIIIKFVCQGKLEDDSMAYLLQLPQTTSTAYAALNNMIDICQAKDFFLQNVTFSEACGETMQTLLDLFRSNAISVERRKFVILALFRVLDYESKETVRTFAAEYGKIFAIKSNGILLQALTYAMLGHVCYRRGIHMMAEYPGLFESLIKVLAPGNDQSVRFFAGECLSNFSQYRHSALKLAVTPHALKTLLHLFVWEDLSLLSTWNPLRRTAGRVLCQLSIVPDNRIKVGALEGIWDGLGGILTKLEEAWWGTDESDRSRLEQQACSAAGILGCLALEKDLRHTIASLPGVKDGLLFLQLLEMTGDLHRNHSDDDSSIDKKFNLSYYCSTRALTVLYSKELAADPSLTDLSSIGDMLNVLFPSWEGTLSKAVTSSMVYERSLCLYWTQVLAYIQMGSYAEGLKSLDHAQHLLCQMPKLLRQNMFCQISSLGYGAISFAHATTVWRECRAFLRAMEDFAGASRGLNRRVEQDLKQQRAQRGYLEHVTDDQRRVEDDARLVQQLQLKHLDDGMLYAQANDLWKLGALFHEWGLPRKMVWGAISRRMVWRAIPRRLRSGGNGQVLLWRLRSPRIEDRWERYSWNNAPMKIPIQ